jgi:uncharacterized membrane protein YoaK (UPF0700 family)
MLTQPKSPALGAAHASAANTPELWVLARRLPPLLSVIAGMVDLTGFLTLGNIFTAHVTGNLVLAAAAAVRGGPLNLAQALAIPVFIAAVAATWLVAQTSRRHGPDLARPLLVVQFVLLAAVLAFSVVTRPSTNPHGLMAGIAVMIAVSAMACQYALLRLALPRVVSTAVMTGNLTNATLTVMDILSKRRSIMAGEAGRLTGLAVLAGRLSDRLRGGRRGCLRPRRLGLVAATRAGSGGRRAVLTHRRQAAVCADCAAPSAIDDLEHLG